MSCRQRVARLSPLDLVRMASAYSGATTGSVYFVVPLLGPRVRTLIGVQYVRSDLVDQIPFGNGGAGGQTALLGMVWAQGVIQRELGDAEIPHRRDERGVGLMAGMGDLVAPQQITVSGGGDIAAKYIEVESLHDAIHGRLQITVAGGTPGKWVLQVVHSPADPMDDSEWAAYLASLLRPRVVGGPLEIVV